MNRMRWSQKRWNSYWTNALTLDLGFIGIPDGAEGSIPSRFMAELIHETLGADNFTSPIVIDRAHWTLAPKPKKGDRPRPMLVRLHYYAQKEQILGLTKGKERCGLPVYIYPNLLDEVSKLRAKLCEAKTVISTVIVLIG